jgi:hypothetical protein
MKHVSNVFKVFIFLMLVFQYQISNAQSTVLSTTPDARLYEAFGQERVDFLVQKNPDMIKYYNFFLDNAFVLVQHPAEKVAGIVSSCPLLEVSKPSLSLDQPNINKGTKSINILKYKFQMEQNTSKQYRLDNSGIVIVFSSATSFMEKYNKARNL